jgi:hypothetical protein
MVRPKHFGFNTQTAGTNRFQQAATQDRVVSHEVAQRALREFDAFAAALAAEGVGVCVVADSDAPPKPDAVFPNNWVSFHADGTVVLYPMYAENRRTERRTEVVDAVVRGNRIQGAPHPRSHRPREIGAIPGRHWQPGAGPYDTRGLRLPFAAHRPGCGAGMGARDGL